MIRLSSIISFVFFVASGWIWSGVQVELLGDGRGGQLEGRQNGNNNNNGQQRTSAFNIVNGRIFTPGLAIILAVRITVLEENGSWI